MASRAFETAFLESPLLRQTAVRLRRLMNEGFADLLLSLSLFTAAAILIGVYLHDKAALEAAVTDELQNTVGTLQEPSDGAKELGLIGAALSKVNAMPAPVEWTCPKPDAHCSSVDELPRELAALVDSGIRQQIPEQSKTPGQRLRFRVVPQPGSFWPELGTGALCSRDDDDTFLLFPAQMKGPDGAEYSDRVVRTARLSSSLGPALKSLERTHKGEKPFSYFVQAYFISPDSLLRIWSRRDTDPCQFPRFRLWAAKSYFSHFWEHPAPADNPHSTLAYIDFGGNGLIRTTCASLELRPPGASDTFLRGNFLGIVCMDFVLPENQTHLMRRQLFFETSLVSFPISGAADSASVRVDISLPPPDSRKAAGTDPAATAQTSANASTGPLLAGSGAVSTRSASTSKDLLAQDKAIEMQAHTLTEKEVRDAIHQELRSPSDRSWQRDVTRIAFRGECAFVLPLGSSDQTFQGLFFFPRTPKLPLYDDCFGVAGFLLAGAAIALLAYCARLRPRTAALAERLSLFRNLQVGIVRVDPADWIFESNDRAEELFGISLPKPGVRRSPVNFQDLIAFRLTGAAPPLNESLTAESVKELRLSGKASAYYARLKDRPQPAWIRVLGTPVMQPSPDRDAASELTMTEIFATLTEVPAETAAGLEVHYQTLFGEAQ